MPPDPLAVDAAERYRERTRRHADAVAVAVLDRFDQLDTSYVSPAVAILVAANLRANGYAATYVDTVTSALTGEATVTTVAVDPVAVDADRLTQATRTAADNGRGSVERLGRSEPLQTGQKAVSEGVRANRKVAGWTRVAGAGACPVCSALADGTVLPDDIVMARPHPSCSCTQAPTTT